MYAKQRGNHEIIRHVVLVVPLLLRAVNPIKAIMLTHGVWICELVRCK